MTEIQALEILEYLEELTSQIGQIKTVIQYADLRLGIVCGLIVALIFWVVFKEVTDK